MTPQRSDDLIPSPFLADARQADRVLGSVNVDEAREHKFVGGAGPFEFTRTRPTALRVTTACHELQFFAREQGGPDADLPPIRHKSGLLLLPQAGRWWVWVDGEITGAVGNVFTLEEFDASSPSMFDALERLQSLGAVPRFYGAGLSAPETVTSVTIRHDVWTLIVGLPPGHRTGLYMSCPNDFEWMWYSDTTTGPVVAKNGNRWNASFFGALRLIGPECMQSAIFAKRVQGTGNVDLRVSEWST